LSTVDRSMLMESISGHLKEATELNPNNPDLPDLTKIASDLSKG
jgi:hypothetical protein